MIKENFIKLVIIVLTVLVFITGTAALKLKNDYTNELDKVYIDSFVGLVNSVNSVENYLAKSMISKSPEHSAETLSQVWRDSNLAMVYLSKLPLSSENVANISKFLNQVSDYTYSLSKKSIKGEELADEDFNNLNVLYGYSKELENTLNVMSDEINSGSIKWTEVTGKDESLAQAVDNLTVFSNIDNNLNNYEGLIYDGAYSDHVSKQNKVGLTGDDVSENEAKDKAKEFLSDYDIEEILLNAYLDNADIPGYDFSVKVKDRNDNINIYISKKGGHVVQMQSDRSVDKENLSNTEAIEIGKEFLSSKKFANMKETYYIKESNTITVNYAYNDGGIVVYPDLIKVKLALDNGEVLGIETTGYLNSHTKREIFEPKITIQKAKENINKKLNIISENMAIIPTKWKTEIICYEFKGKVNDKDFIVYINADTGEEEDILVVLDTQNGVLTM